MRIQFVLFVLSIGQMASHGVHGEDSDEEEHEPMQYQCTSPNILTIYNRTNEYLITQCSPPVICGQTKACVISKSTVCPLKFQYLSGVQEMPDKTVMSTCSRITPQPDDADEICQESDVFDKTLQGEPCDSQLTSPTCKILMDMRQKNKPIQNEPIRKNERQKRSVPTTIVEEMELTMFDVKDRHASVEYIKQIMKIPKGYRVKFCQVQCRSTSTRRPTTTSAPTKEPQQDHKHMREETQEKSHKKTLLNGQHCFSGDVTVLTPSGQKRMNDLRVGDEVMVLTSESTQKYQKIEWFYHRDINQTVDFMTISTKSGQHISLSPNHLLPLVPCKPDSISFQEMDKLMLTSTFFASKARLGACLAVKIHDRNLFKPDPIISIVQTRKRGVFSPITDHGSILVNNIQASCYSSFENQAVQRAIHSVLIKINRSIESIKKFMNMNFSAGEDENIPVSLKFLLQFANSILPLHVFK